MPLPRAFDQKWFDEHRCQWCGKKCRPRYERSCKHCKHGWWQHALMPDGHCSGKLELPTSRQTPLVPCDCQQIGDLRHNPTAFTKVLKGYGLDDDGFFCKQECAVGWAHYQIRQARKDR